MRLKGFMPNFFQTHQTGSEKKEFSLKGRKRNNHRSKKYSMQTGIRFGERCRFWFQINRLKKLIIIQPKFIFYSVEIKQRNSI